MENTPRRRQKTGEMCVVAGCFENKWHDSKNNQTRYCERHVLKHREYNKKSKIKKKVSR